MNSTIRSEFQAYERYFAPCPKCGHEYGFIGEPRLGDRIGCYCGTHLVIVKHRQSGDCMIAGRYYLEIDTKE